MLLNQRKLQVARFQSMMELARELALANPSALPDLVRLLGRSIQSAAIAEVAASAEHGTSEVELKTQLLFSPRLPISVDGRNTDELLRQIPNGRALRLGVDLVFSQPWHRKRLVGTLARIGDSAPRKAWKQDRTNHLIEWWLPMGIGWVHGGNHSIAVGIVQAEGQMPPTSAYDASPLFDQVSTDGWWYHSRARRRFARVRCVEMAAIFEIGRLMRECGVSA